MLSTEKSVRAAVDYLHKKGKLHSGAANMICDYANAYIKVETAIAPLNRLKKWNKKRSG